MELVWPVKENARIAKKDWLKAVVDLKREDKEVNIRWLIPLNKKPE